MRGCWLSLESWFPWLVADDFRSEKRTPIVENAGRFLFKFLSNIDGASFFLVGLGNFVPSYEQILPLDMIW